ncbi:MAG: histone H1 [Gammaproteobacteria bacterium]
MRKQVKQKNRPTDINQIAHKLVQLSTQDTPHEAPLSVISQYMAQIGSKGGQIGGKRRLETLTPNERIKIAKKAARARWNKYKKV